MKSVSIAVILSLAASVAADQTWYSPELNSTCTHNDTDGNISCEFGHLDDAPVIVGDTTPSIRGREANPLDKRVTCGLPILDGASCHAHCLLIDFCNSECVDGICRCSCIKDDGWKGTICAKNSCSGN